MAFGGAEEIMTDILLFVVLGCGSTVECLSIMAR